MVMAFLNKGILAMAAPSVSVRQFTVSTQLSSNQGQTSVTALMDGRIVVTWQDFGSNTGDIKTRILSPTGAVLGSETTVNTMRTGVQESPKIAALATGGYVVVWEDFSGTTGGDIRYRVYNAAGVAITGERTAHASTAGVQQDPSVIATADGGFMIGYSDGNTAATGLLSSTAAMLRRFDISGNAAGAAVRLSGDWGGEWGPQLATRNLQTYAAVWDDDLGPSSTRNGEDGLYSRSFTGFPGTNFTDGGTRVTTGSFREAPRTPDIAMTASGTVIVWEDRPTLASNIDIWMSYKGLPPVRINTTSAGPHVDPHVAALGLGGFVVVWLDQGSGDGGNIRARVFTEAGVATSLDFLVSDVAKTAGSQFDPDVTALIDGRFMVTWADQSNTSGIEAKIFDPRTAAINVAGGTMGEYFVGTAFNDTIRGNDGDDKIWGAAGNDLINGGNRNDAITGGAGNDTLYGGTGADDFIFATTPGTGNVDRLQDFSSAQGDDIVLAAARFGAIGPSLGTGELRFGTRAADANDFLIYDRSTGRLWYDKDGDGSVTQVLVAVLDPNTSLGLGNFEIQI